jgi:hypothetical protein
MYHSVLESVEGGDRDEEYDDEEEEDYEDDEESHADDDEVEPIRLASTSRASTA